MPMGLGPWGWLGDLIAEAFAAASARRLAPPPRLAMRCVAEVERRHARPLNAAVERAAVAARRAGQSNLSMPLRRRSGSSPGVGVAATPVAAMHDAVHDLRALRWWGVQRAALARNLRALWPGGGAGSGMGRPAPHAMPGGGRPSHVRRTTPESPRTRAGATGPPCEAGRKPRGAQCARSCRGSATPTPRPPSQPFVATCMLGGLPRTSMGLRRRRSHRPAWIPASLAGSPGTRRRCVQCGRVSRGGEAPTCVVCVFPTFFVFPRFKA